MARSDLLINLVTAGSTGDTKLFQRTVEALIAEERGKQHHILAERLEESLKLRPVTKETTTFINDGIRGLLYEQSPYKPLN
ncbi:AAA family ATPase, partial [Clostridioides difficile]